MKANYPNYGFEDAVLNSADDYEPYGFAEPKLLPVDSVLQPGSAANGVGAYDRVIEAALLARWSHTG